MNLEYIMSAQTQGLLLASSTGQVKHKGPSQKEKHAIGSVHM
jgi:hypothetical protein